MSTKEGDRVRVSVQVTLDPSAAFRVFTEEIDRWWRRGPRFRASGTNRGILRLEPEVGGRLFESFDQHGKTVVVQTGTVVEWAPPRALAFEWRNVNFAPNEVTLVEVEFAANPRGTMVTVTHSGWAAIRPDHPARHGLPVNRFIRQRAMWWSDLMTAYRRHPI